MRITNSMMISRMMTNMNRNLSRMDKIQNDINSGVKIHKPSDDPVLVARSLKLNTDIAENDQFKRNIDDASSMLDKTETALTELNSVVLRIRDLSVQASNGVLTDKDTQQIKAEISQLKDQIVKISNDTYVGRHIFSGYKTDQPYLNDNGSNNINLDKEIKSDALNISAANPINTAAPNNSFELDITGITNPDGSKSTGKYTINLAPKTYDGTTGNTLSDLASDIQTQLNNAVPADYKKFEVKVENNQVVIKNPAITDNQKFALVSTDNGNTFKNLGLEKTNICKSTENVNFQIGVSANLKVNISGDEVFGPVVDSNGDKIPDKTLMDTVNELLNHLEKGETSKISDQLKEIDGHRNNISKILGEVGARTNTIDAISNRIDDMNLNFTKLLSETVDTDMAEAYTQMSAYESVYKASLSVGAKVIQPTLIDFLR